DARARFHVIHEILPEDAHLETGEARVLQPPRIDSLILNRNMRLICRALPDGGNVDRNAGFRAAQQPEYRLADYLAYCIPKRFLQHSLIEQPALQMLLHGK